MELKDMDINNPIRKLQINRIYNEDCLDTMQSMKEDNLKVDLIFTSPPYYNAKDYSHYAGYQIYREFIRTMALMASRILKEGRFFIINTSPILEPRPNRQGRSTRRAIPFDIHEYITDSGFDFIDDIIWKKPEGSAKNRHGGFLQHGRPLAYKPNIITEYVMVYRKQSEHLIDWNIRQMQPDIIEDSLVKDEYEPTNVWNISPASSPDHPAIFPEKLARQIIRFYSYKGDTVYDPFSGMGTTAKMAIHLGRNYIGSEINKKYYDLSLKNIKNQSQVLS